MTTKIKGFGARLKALRAERGLTQGELASLMKYDRTTLAQVETGHRRPWPKFLMRAARALDLDVWELCSGGGDDDDAG